VFAHWGSDRFPLQIIDEDIPMTEHDIPLSAIVTPQAMVAIAPLFKRSREVYWKMLAQEKPMPFRRLACISHEERNPALDNVERGPTPPAMTLFVAQGSC
jgi:hypothetical protein